MTNAINTQTCKRCGGSGSYSFNPIDGDKCYGCGGTGKQIVAPKGQKKIKPTATLKDCKVGDIIEMSKVICEVTSIKWIKLSKGYNQVVRYTRLVNGETMKTWRTARVDESRDASAFIGAENERGFAPIDWDGLRNLFADLLAQHPNGSYSVEHTRNLAHFCATIEPTEDMIGTEV
jgi:hypothetical protein